MSTPFTVSQSMTAMLPGLATGFAAEGSYTSPIVYSVQAGGAGGTIDPSSGVYTAPAAMNSNPALTVDVIIATDSTTPVPNTATASILITNVLGLFCDVIQNQLGLAQGRVYEWDQKIFQPSDNGLYVVVSVLNCKPFGNSLVPASSSGGLNALQSVNLAATLGVDIISRGPAARDRKEEVVLALASAYSQQQQEANGFYIANLPTSFVNLSSADGAAIPYRFNISVAIQYAFTKTVSIPYFGTFAVPEIYTNP